jgi:predicted nucleic acid-binding Zn ribbon protein
MSNFPYKKKYASPKRERQMNLLSIDGILGTALKQHNLDREISKYSFVLHWESIVGAELAKVSKPDSIVNKQLVVRVKSSVWAQHLSFYQQVISSRVKKYLEPGQEVEGLRFKVEG